MVCTKHYDIINLVLNNILVPLLCKYTVWNVYKNIGIKIVLSVHMNISKI